MQPHVEQDKTYKAVIAMDHNIPLDKFIAQGIVIVDGWDFPDKADICKANLMRSTTHEEAYKHLIRTAVSGANMKMRASLNRQ